MGDAVDIFDSGEDALSLLGADLAAGRRRSFYGGGRILWDGGCAAAILVSVPKSMAGRGMQHAPRRSGGRLLQGTIWPDEVLAQRGLQEIDPRGLARSRLVVVVVPVLGLGVDGGGFGHHGNSDESMVEVYCRAMGGI